MQLSEQDQRLIRALKRDARKSISDLARELNLSRTTVKYHLSKLEASGVIAGYGVRLGDAFDEQTLQSYVNLQVQPKLSTAIFAKLQKIDEIEALFTVSGKIDMVLLVRTTTPPLLDNLLDKIGQIEGVISTESAIVLSTKFDRR